MWAVRVFQPKYLMFAFVRTKARMAGCAGEFKQKVTQHQGFSRSPSASKHWLQKIKLKFWGMDFLMKPRLFSQKNNGSAVFCLHQTTSLYIYEWLWRMCLSSATLFLHIFLHSGHCWFVLSCTFRMWLDNNSLYLKDFPHWGQTIWFLEPWMLLLWFLRIFSVANDFEQRLQRFVSAGDVVTFSTPCSHCKWCSRGPCLL